MFAGCLAASGAAEPVQEDAGVLPAAPLRRSTWRPPAPSEDFDYVPPDDTPDEDLQCSVCLGWPVDPVVLGCPGGHMFCRRCVKGGLCPLDRQPFARFAQPQRPIVTLLGRLQVRCSEAQLGCPWVGPRSNLEDHKAACAFVERECAVCGLRMRPSEGGFADHGHGAEGAETPAALRPRPSEEADASAPAACRREAIGRVIDVYEQAERLNVCFVVDCTGSMGRHIGAVKDQIRWIVHELRARLPSMQLHLAFVGYRDHCDSERIVELPFTRSVSDFRGCLAAVRATGGGGDGPEDVHGALERACELDWSINGAATRVVIHIADYPAHGSRYNDCPGDSYPQGDPRGLDLEALVRRLKDLSVQYVFGHITGHTQKMTRVLNEALGEDYIGDKDMMNVELVAEVVTATLHTSVASTVSTLTSSPGADALPPVVLGDHAPDWQGVSPDEVVLRECRRVADVGCLQPGADPSLTRQMEERTATVSLAALPFSQGETRVARHALREDGRAAVAKHFKRPSDDEGDDDSCDADPRDAGVDAYIALSETSAVAGFLAELFSSSRQGDEWVEFLASAAAHGPTVVPFNLEDALPVGDFRRFSNNIGWWEPDAPRLLMEFSRFTHEVTSGHMMVADLQGVKTGTGWLLTDPCVLCEDVARFGSGNMGPRAIDRCLAALKVRLDEEPVAREMAAPAEPLRLQLAPAVPAVPWRPPKTAPVFAQDVGLQLDDLIGLLLGAKSQPGSLVPIPLGQIQALLRVARDAFLRQPTLLELQAPLNVMGDTHGQFHDLLQLLDAGGLPPDMNYLMLGDYVDRGKQSIEVVCLLLAYKVKYPENFFMLRGNHECASINRIYGFYDECKRRYSVKLWKQFCDVFNCLPPAALIDDKILCMHGGVSPELTNFDSIRNLPRPTDVPDTGLLCDLLWADPDRDVSGWAENDRGVSMSFGPDALSGLMSRLGVELVARAHQVVEDGYEFFGGRQLVTIFSAPNYCNEFDNAAALMQVQENLMCTFKLLKPSRAQQARKWRWPLTLSS